MTRTDAGLSHGSEDSLVYRWQMYGQAGCGEGPMYRGLGCMYAAVRARRNFEDFFSVFQIVLFHLGLRVRVSGLKNLHLSVLVANSDSR